jgi:hypothetical protein
VARRIWISILAACAAGGQDQARKAADYPAHASWQRFQIGAEYMVHSIPTEKGALYARDYLIVEVAISPSKRPVAISSGAFTLRVNGKKTVLSTESAGFVAASLKYADWEQRHPVMTGTAQVGDGTVIVGQPPNPDAFPAIPRGIGGSPSRGIRKIPMPARRRRIRWTSTS